MPKDYYEVLGISKNVTQEEIKKAYRDLAKKYHPDVNKDKTSNEKFKEINEAFSVLSNEEKRQRYDQYGTTEPNTGFEEGFDMNDIFSSFGFGDIFGDKEENYDVKTEITITLEDAFNGTNKKINVRVPDFCEKCKGKGGTDIKTCRKCNGTGRVQQMRRAGFMQFMTMGTCKDCHGSGKKIENICPRCKGDGIEIKEKNIDFSIPKGIEDKQYIRLKGGKGDIYILIKIKDHDIFERDEKDLYCKTTISLEKAILGGEISVPTISGRATLTIPKGTQSHTKFRLRGQGMHSIHGSRGDQYVLVVVQIPEKLNKEQEDIIQSLSVETKTTKGFFETLKDFMR